MSSLTDKYVGHQLRLIKLANGQRIALRNRLAEMEQKIVQVLSSGTGGGLGTRPLAMTLKEIDSYISDAYFKIAQYQNTTNKILIGVEAEWAQRAAKYANPASAAGLERAFKTLNLMGSTIDEQWGLQAAQISQRVAAQVRQGVEAGMTAGAVIDKVKASGVLEGALKQGKGIVDAAVHSAADAGRRATMLANGVHAVRWHAILDPKVCLACAERDGKLWDMDGKPVGHTIPYATPVLHPWCRCILLPMKYKDGIIPQDGGMKKTSFEQWIKKQTPEKQEALLGPGRFKLWQDGKITLKDLIDQNGSVMSLKQLKAEVKATGKPTPMGLKKKAGSFLKNPPKPKPPPKPAVDVNQPLPFHAPPGSKWTPDGKVAAPAGWTQTAVGNWVPPKGTPLMLTDKGWKAAPGWYHKKDGTFVKDKNYVSPNPPPNPAKPKPAPSAGGLTQTDAVRTFFARHEEQVQTMSTDRLYAMRDYAGSGYRPMNAELRALKFNPTATLSKPNQLVRSAIQEAPPFERDIQLWRGRGSRQDHAIGDVIEAEGFFSSSAERKTGEAFGRREMKDPAKGYTLYQIIARKGTRAITAHEGETEFMFDHGTRMRVVSRQDAQRDTAGKLFTLFQVVIEP